MSPASQTDGGLHVERYIGSYLVSNSSRNNSRKIHSEYDGCGGNGKPSSKQPQYVGGHHLYRGGYVPADGIFCPPPFCQNRNNWAGVPLISTANPRRNGKLHPPTRPAPHSPPYHQQRVPVVNGACNLEYGENQQIPLSKLALHTRGAPLILSRRYNNNGNRKQTQYQNNTRQYAAFGPNRAPVVPDMVQKIKDIPKENRYEYKDHAIVSRTHVPVQNGHLPLNMDSLSVTSDESSGSAHSEACLPRIIKPRKRRKKDRKPLVNNLQDKDMSSDSKLESNDPNPDLTLLNLNPYFSNCQEMSDMNHNATNFKPVIVNSNLLDYVKLYSSTDVLNSNVGNGKFVPVCNADQRSPGTSDSLSPRKEDDVGDSESDDSSSLFEAISRCSPTVCQCRYCDPSGQIWDIDRRCYSPLLTTPGEFDILGEKNSLADKDSLLRRSWSEPCPGYSVANLRISEYDKHSTPHRSDPNITSTSGLPDNPGAGDPCTAKSVGVIGAGRRSIKSLDSPRTLDWNETTAPQSQLVPQTLFKSSSSHGVSLEVSSAIVTSLNGHRDLEIKFFSTSPSAVVSQTASFVYPNRLESDDNSTKNESIDSLKCEKTDVSSVKVQ